MEINTISIIILFGLLQGLLVLTVFAWKRRIKEHKYLIALFIVMMLVQFHSFLLESKAMLHVIFYLNVDIPLVLLFGPLIFFYTRSLLGESKPKNLEFLHYIPFVFYFLYSFHFFLQPAKYKYNLVVELLGLELPMQSFVKSFSSDPWNIQGWVVVEIITLHLLTYAIAGLYKVHNKISSAQISSQKFKWLQFLNGIFLLGALIIFFSEGGVINGREFMPSPLPNFSGDLFSTVAVYGIIFYLLNNSDLLSFSLKKYKKSSLSKGFMQAKIKQIMQAIEQEKLYLNPNFGLDLLTNKTGLSRHHLSQIINEELGTSFSELTNRYRTEEAKKLLQQNNFEKMEGLAYDLGYRSKSTFYNAFKRATQLTPSQYYQSVNE